MKLTKKLEAEILDAYNAIWGAYLKGDMKTFASLLDENCHIIGSAAGEVFSNKKSAVKYYKSTADQITGKAEFRNRKISVMPVDKGVMVNEQTDFYLLIDNQWTFYGYARISSLFRKKNNKWKVIHQHGSFPDSKAEEGEQVNAVKIKAENLQLRDAVKRRTVELEHKNRELEIETALERVRARTMAMRNSQELSEVIEKIYNEFKQLGSGAYAVDLMIFTEDKKGYYKWVSGTGGTQGPYLTPEILHNHPHHQGTMTAWMTGDTIRITELTGDLFTSYFNIVLKDTAGMPYIDEETRNNILSLGRLVHTEVFTRHGCIRVASSEKGTDAQIDIQKKFANVFNQTYIRFLDLQKAEAQAREAQIEAGLERVRSRSLAMHNTSELQEVIYTVHKELLNLNIAISGGSFIAINSDIETTLRCWGSGGTADTSEEVHLPLYEKPFCTNLINRIKNGPGFFTEEYTQQEKKDFFTFLFKYEPWSKLDAKQKNETLSSPGGYTRSCCVSQHTSIFIINHFGEKFTSADNEILKRFGKVFEQTYSRFLDLQKAEAQAREAQLEASLERVRAKAMSMQKSDDLAAAVAIVFEQLDYLNLGMLRCGIGILNKEKRSADVWTTTKSENDTVVQVSGDESMDIHPLLTGAFDSWVNQSDFSYILEGDDLARYYSTQRGDSFKLPESQLVLSPSQIQRQYYYLAEFYAGGLFAFSDSGFTDEVKQVMKRFANVFDLTYKRFLDLQKAEAQAREAQIEASLERVRAKAMAMQKSEDLAAAVAIVFEQLDKLNLGMSRCSIGILNIDKRSADVWTTTKSDNDTVVQVSGDESIDIHPLLQGTFDAWLNGEDFDYVLKGEDLNDYYKALSGSNFRLPDSQSLSAGSNRSQQYYYNAAFSAGGLCAFRETEFPEEAKAVLRRFADVFNLTYTRFNDLKQAEAQAREAKIEAALERVRSRTMAMHRSEEIADIVGKIFGELSLLDLVLNRVLIWIFDDEKKYISWWSANPEAESNAESYRIDYNDQPAFLSYLQAWQKRIPLHQYTLSGDLKKKFEDHLFANTELSKLPVAVREGMRGEGAIFTTSTISDYGLMMVGSFEPLSDENVDIIQRFGRVFQQSYTRYLDVQKAEAQAREAKIEAAMEKVRARAMAMQKPEELEEVAQVLRREMGLLGVEELETSSIYIHDEFSGATECWYAIQDIRVKNKSLVTDHMTLNLNDTWVGREMIKFHASGQKQTSILMQGEKRKEWINYCADHSSVLQGYYGEVIPERTYHLLKFSNGFMGAASPGEISAESWELLKRATIVFSLAYTRFSDLQLAEAHAKEAIKQSALDRIRADIASMRTITDLDRIPPLIWKELTILGVPFIRCGVFIMDESQQLIHTFLSTPDGKAIAAFHLPFDTPGNIAQVLSHWNDRKNYIDHWEESAFTAFAKILGQQQTVVSAEQYLKTIPRGGFYLHFLPFSQGMLYVGNTSQLNEEEIKLIQTVADAFSTAYARYEDFNKLEAAKQQVDKTLVELKLAQTQLVQSEKMASLGELTAGIAHEIQNPLNFVNNFSDVSNELLEEMKNELEKGNKEDAMAIVEDVKQNLEKILHHGKRADAIVKGMLQHSRTSSGQKEPTDINALADEYLRLAFHGLRAKDKSFNAKFETDFDSNIGTLNVIPQEIGRVILNLINNAFYAVTEKRKQNQNGYEPTVTITTRKLLDKIEIRISDNGNGIPQKNLDKIFQPFFTTKPTGQGTGLGLSLSYDIITKGHGGEMKVETKEGAGTEFIVVLNTDT